MPNRNLQPELVAIDAIDFVAPKKYDLSPTVPLYHMKEVQNETSRFDLYFDAGNCRGEKGTPGFTNGLLLSGTPTKTSVQIQEEINSLGGFLESGVSVENATVSMYCLRENLKSILNTILDAIKHVDFKEDEIKELCADRKQKWRINQEKVATRAQQEFRSKLFSSNDRYAITLEEKDFDNVQQSDLKEFHEKFYLQGLTKVVIVGNFEEETILEIAEYFNQFLASEIGDFDPNVLHEPGIQKIDKEGALQTAIRAGRMLFNKNHPDYLDFLFVNTILGDYFGSRLMANIREDKGYTYGIGSMVAELDGTGYFLMATEVGKEVRDETLKEIQFELTRLQTELVPEDEMQLVRNYVLGQLLKSADGAYAMTDLFLSAELHGKTLDFYNDAIKSIHGITPERVQELAKKYLKWEYMAVVAVG
ncbi:MAG: pitrilysin family protein [Crocinitomicaceae bacterium]|nr:pitrilysin family protein [Crocinitomicaceae bacterium]